jgi:hypothetical protein
MRERDEGAPLQRLGADRHHVPAGVPADPPPALAREEPLHVLPLLGAGRPPGHDDLLHHHRRAALASGSDLQNRKGHPGWDTSQARAYDAICRHTALTALAQLRTTAIRAAISGPSAVPVTGPDTAAACQGTAAPSGENTVSAAGLQFYRHGAPLPSSGGQPCPPSPASPRSGCPTPRPPASTASPATGKPGSSPPPASPSISAGQHGAGSTRPAPAGTTTAPASRPSPPNLRRTKGSDTV